MSLKVDINVPLMTDLAVSSKFCYIIISLLSS